MVGVIVVVIIIAIAIIIVMQPWKKKEENRVQSFDNPMYDDHEKINKPEESKSGYMDVSPVYLNSATSTSDTQMTGYMDVASSDTANDDWEEDV